MQTNQNNDLKKIKESLKRLKDETMLIESKNSFMNAKLWQHQKLTLRAKYNEKDKINSFNFDENFFDEIL